MDCLETCVIPLTAACEPTGSPGEQRPRPGRPLRSTGSASCETRSEEDRADPEAKQISDRLCVAGSRSTSIVPVKSGRADVLPRVVLCRQVTDGVICTSASEALP